MDSLVRSGRGSKISEFQADGFAQFNIGSSCNRPSSGDGAGLAWARGIRPSFGTGNLCGHLDRRHWCVWGRQALGL